MEQITGNVKVTYTPEDRWSGFHSPFYDREPMAGDTNVVRDAWAVHHWTSSAELTLVLAASTHGGMSRLTYL